MTYKSDNQRSHILFIPHGGGPLPLLGDKGRRHLVKFLQEIPSDLGQPSAILVISAHWEENIATITSGANPSLIYDYYGFPDASYQIQYPAPGSPGLADKIFQLQAKPLLRKLRLSPFGVSLIGLIEQVP
jgi:4,5-DOPA dioxygenase extradiol